MLFYGCLFLTVNLSYSQQLISGNILDNIGKQVTFASIIENDTSFGTTSNKKGEFTLNIKKLPSRVTISSPHYKQKTITLTSRRKITIILQRKSIKTSSTNKGKKQ